ncbi:MAG TPA: hypothetical protein VGM24_04200, partial [Puia sp.]
MTRHAWLAALLVVSYQTVSAQTATTPPPAAQQQPPEAPFRKSPTVPEFSLIKADSIGYITKEDIKKHHP